MSKVDWANLLSQDRCKALGVPWSAEELKAIHGEGVPANYVRAGILTKKAYDKQLKRESVEGKKLDTMNLGELQEEANGVGVEYVGITPRETLIDLIKKARLLAEAGIEEEEEDEEEDDEEEETEEEETDEEDDEEEEDEEEEEEEEKEKPKEKVKKKVKPKKKAKTKKKRSRKKKD